MSTVRYFQNYFFFLKLKDQEIINTLLWKIEGTLQKQPLLLASISWLPGVLHLSLSGLLENAVEDLRALSSIFSSSYPAACFRHLQQSHAWTKMSSPAPPPQHSGTPPVAQHLDCWDLQPKVQEGFGFFRVFLTLHNKQINQDLLTLFRHFWSLLFSPRLSLPAVPSQEQGREILRWGDKAGTGANLSLP